MSCECQNCKRAHEVYDRLQRLPEGEREFWEIVYNDLESVEAELNWCEAVIDGSWPMADEIIERTRARIEVTPAGRAMLKDGES